ncbi:hypothetical protein GUITHDRAFT_115435 [Guillardia theta CCMP2712]|uniref:Uncharacterized protein n=1 Tax=Guillardia theta (strain CCMP2712) TaxID=905079 RepID=L1IRL5_GUITC|nr:hypothetical protein GUITHDRAFT_115435 [Guillardia theta CCMP2712]EKX38470.1 hypothetical protein GUITHDRAFT_115435 [Guillardia theta CCMP2712]|eukprot:XP_005825450.1 hypothetical protein GUITHDRAFT_115435 [Guillardia theta CCMP2712]
MIEINQQVLKCPSTNTDINEIISHIYWEIKETYDEVFIDDIDDEDEIEQHKRIIERDDQDLDYEIHMAIDNYVIDELDDKRYAIITQGREPLLVLMEYIEEYGQPNLDDALLKAERLRGIVSYQIIYEQIQALFCQETITIEISSMMELIDILDKD